MDDAEGGCTVCDVHAIGADTGSRGFVWGEGKREDKFLMLSDVVIPRAGIGILLY